MGEKLLGWACFFSMNRSILMLINNNERTQYHFEIFFDFGNFPDVLFFVWFCATVSFPPVSQFFHILPDDDLQMLSDCFVKAPALRFVATGRMFVSETFRHSKDLSCTIQTLEHVVQHNKALTSLKTRKSKKSRPCEI